MLVLGNKVGESLVVQHTSEIITHLKVISVQGSTVTFSVETRTKDKKLKAKLRTQDPA